MCATRPTAPRSTPTGQSLIDGIPIAAPAPLTDCPVQFGNNDIYDGTYLDPTP